MTAYIFDTSALIEPWVRLYPPDRFRSVWDQMDALISDGRAKAPEEVLAELKSKDDDLYDWAKERRSELFVPTTRALLSEVAAVLADHPFLTKTGTGRNQADPFVIALASLQRCPVVTQERGGSESKPKIPYVCDDRDVACMGFLDVIRAEDWHF